MVFVELTPFVRFREQSWTDEELRALERFLLLTPRQLKALATLMKEIADG